MGRVLRVGEVGQNRAARVKAALAEWESANLRVENARHAQYKAGIEFAQHEDALANLFDEYKRNGGK